MTSQNTMLPCPCCKENSLKNQGFIKHVLLQGRVYGIHAHRWYCDRCDFHVMTHDQLKSLMDELDWIILSMREIPFLSKEQLR